MKLHLETYSYEDLWLGLRMYGHLTRRVWRTLPSWDRKDIHEYRWDQGSASISSRGIWTTNKKKKEENSDHVEQIDGDECVTPRCCRLCEQSRCMYRIVRKHSERERQTETIKRSLWARYDYVPHARTHYGRRDFNFIVWTRAHERWWTVLGLSGWS